MKYLRKSTDKMIIKSNIINNKNLTWTLRSPNKSDGAELSSIRIKIDGETEFLDREPGEALLTKADFEKIIVEDNLSSTSLFLLSEVNGEIVGFSRCVGNKLIRFKHKAEFGICILKDYWGFGIGKILIENTLINIDTSGIKKISLNVVETNEKAIKLYEKYGFAREGLLINDRMHKDGQYYNTIIMGRFLDEEVLSR